MNEEQAKDLASKAAAIAKATAESLKIFTKETAMLLYAKQMQQNALPNFPKNTEHKKINNKEANAKLEKMMIDAKLKWKYATDDDKKKVLKMEMIIIDSDNKIKELYKPILTL